MTVYSDNQSEISRLNATAHLGPVAVERGLFGLLERVVARASSRAPLTMRRRVHSAGWGFVRGPKRVPDAETLADARARTGWQHLRLNPENLTVGFDRPGIRINLGSIGKGYAIDRAVEVIRQHWFSTSALIYGGQSQPCSPSVHRPAGSAAAGKIVVRNPLRPETPLGGFASAIAAWAPREVRSNSSSWTVEPMAISSTPGPESPPQAVRRA